jgi:hypothetical protein
VLIVVHDDPLVGRDVVRERIEDRAGVVHDVDLWQRCVPARPDAAPEDVRDIRGEAPTPRKEGRDRDRESFEHEVDAEQARLAQAGLAAVDERDTTCCYARQDKFWVTGALGGERWEIYTVLADSPTFWGQDGEQRWDAVEAELDGALAGQATQCCGCPQAASATGDAATGVCCA